MRFLRSILVLLVASSFGVGLVLPSKDVPETPYDESEVLPFESAPSASDPVISSERYPGPEEAYATRERILPDVLSAVDVPIPDHPLRC
jgi:hypothetical protein